MTARERRTSLGNIATSSSTPSLLNSATSGLSPHAPQLQSQGSLTGSGSSSTINLMSQSQLPPAASGIGSQQQQQQQQQQPLSRSQSPQPMMQQTTMKMSTNNNNSTNNLMNQVNPVNIIPHLQTLSSVVAEQQNQIITLIGAMSGTASLQSVHSLPSVSGGLRKI